MMNRLSFPVAALAWAAFAVCVLSCASEKHRYTSQIDALAQELADLYPIAVEQAIDFAALRSHLMNLSAEGLEEELIEMFEQEGPWHRQVLFAYMLALAGSNEGFGVIIKKLNDKNMPPRQREGLVFSGMKYLGYTELEGPAQVTGREADLSEWKKAMGRIDEIGIHAWRLEKIQKIILSGEPGSGDEALMAATWLSYTLKPGDVPFLADLLERGSPKCDMAILRIVESLLMRRFQPDEVEENSLESGLEAFRAWHEENFSKPPDLWITQAYIDAGYAIEDLYNQNSISKIVNGLYDNGEQWVLMRSHTLAALNRISGFRVDRALIFESEEVREDVVESYLAWYRELAARVKTE